MAFPRNEVSDFSVRNEFTIFLLHPLTDAARKWIAEHIGAEAQRFGEAVVVEHRYICDIIDGILADGLEVR